FRQLFPHFFLFNDTAPTEIYTLSLHDALPIWLAPGFAHFLGDQPRDDVGAAAGRESDDDGDLAARIDTLRGGARSRQGEQHGDGRLGERDEQITTPSMSHVDSSVPGAARFRPSRQSR